MGGCFITTAVCDVLGLPNDNPVLNKFRKFRDEHMGGKEALKDYYKFAPAIVEEIKKKDIGEFYDILSLYLIPALYFIDTDQYEKAENVYGRMFNEMKAKYLEA
jgi:hypothetical protein